MEKDEIIKTVTDRLTGAGFQVDNGVITCAYPQWKRLNHDFIHIAIETRFDCGTWHDLLFDIALGQKYIPSPCFNCYKVVIAIPTVAELFGLYNILKRLNIPSKCGLDGNRVNTNRLYAGYVYNVGLEEGRERKELIRKEVDERIGTHIQVILKRGCTEYEQIYGPSDKWWVVPEQLETEKIVFENFRWGIKDVPQDIAQVSETMSEWIKRAYQWGDQSYLKLTGGKPLYQPCVTY